MLVLCDFLLGSTRQEATAHLLRGRVSLERNEPKEAIAELDIAVAEDPKPVEALEFRGRAYVLLGQNDLALLDFNRAEKVDELLTPASLYRARGELYVRLEQWDRAIVDYTRVIEAPARWPDANAYLARACAYMAIKRGEAAVQDCRTALEIVPDNPVCLLALGDAYRLVKEYGHAIESYQKSLDRNHPQAEPLLHMAACYALWAKDTADLNRRKELETKAFDSLTKLKASGFKDVNRFAKDPVFDALWNDPRWKTSHYIGLALPGLWASRGSCHVFVDSICQFGG